MVDGRNFYWETNRIFSLLPALCHCWAGVSSIAATKGCFDIERHGSICLHYVRCRFFRALYTCSIFSSQIWDKRKIETNLVDSIENLQLVNWCFLGRLYCNIFFLIHGIYIFNNAITLYKYTKIMNQIYEMIHCMHIHC